MEWCIAITWTSISKYYLFSLRNYLRIKNLFNCYCLNHEILGDFGVVENLTGWKFRLGELENTSNNSFNIKTLRYSYLSSLMKAVLNDILNIFAFEMAPLFFILNSMSPEMGLLLFTWWVKLSCSVNFPYSEWLFKVVRSLVLLWTLMTSMNGLHPSSLYLGLPIIYTSFISLTVGYILRSFNI